MLDTSEQLYRVFCNALESHRQQLAMKGITFGCPTHKVWDDSAKRFTSEVQVFFFRDSQLVDVFEFHLFREGGQNVDSSEIEEWVHDQFESVGPQGGPGGTVE